jgi:hypothetical protein
LQEASIARWAESHFSCHNSSNGNSGQLQPPLTASVDDLRYASSLVSATWVTYTLLVVGQHSALHVTRFRHQHADLVREQCPCWDSAQLSAGMHNDAKLIASGSVDLKSFTSKMLNHFVFCVFCAAYLQMGTRFFAPQDGGSYLLMLPLLDMADHWNGCPHTYQAGPCSSTQAGNGQEGGKRCVIWNAGDSVAAGAEVCNGYK